MAATIYYNDLVNIFLGFECHVSNKRFSIEARNGSYNFGSALLGELRRLLHHIPPRNLDNIGDKIRFSMVSVINSTTVQTTNTKGIAKYHHSRPARALC